MNADLDRRKFLEHTVGTGAALGLGALAAVPAARAAIAEPTNGKKIRVAVIGCGSVSGKYLPHLSKCPYAELVSTCDIIPERAVNRAKEFNVPNNFPHITKLLAGPDFDLMVNLTDMQEHEHLNREGIAAGKHIWSEKPIANTLAAGQEILEQAKKKGVRVWGARWWFPARSLPTWPRRSTPARWAAWPPPTPITDIRGRIGRPSSTRRAAAACPTWASTTSPA